MSQSLLRSCAGCSAHILVNDGKSDKVWCKTCRPKYVTPFDTWAAGLKIGDSVYVQPYIAPAHLGRSQWLIRTRDGDNVTLSLLGVPDRTIETTIGQLAQHALVR